MRILSDRDVERLIEPADAIAAVADGYRRHSSGLMPAPGRLDMGRSEPRGSALVLAGHGDGPAFALKANMHVYPEPHAHHRKAASMMLLWDAVRCAPTALLTTTQFNNHRTAAGLAAAVVVLAPRDARTLTVFGAGKIAPAVIRYLAAVRSFERVFVLGRGRDRAGELVASLRSERGLAAMEIEASADAAAAARMADVIVTVTTSETAVCPGRDVRAGALVVLAGANRPHAREADDDLIRRARIYVDHRDGCVSRAGDLCIPLQSGVLRTAQIVAEIGSLSAAPPPVAAPLDITVFKSIGIIAQDIALAELIVARAERMGIGIEFDPVSGACDGQRQEPAAEQPAEILP